MVRNETFGRGGVTPTSALAAALALALVLICGPPAMAQQMKDMQVPSPSIQGETEIGDPDAIFFCQLDPCPGKTCDEVNNRCVGNVTLQPRMGEPLTALNWSQSTRFNLGKTAFDRTFIPSEGLGPTFNQDSCSSCHNNPIGGSGTITVTRFGFIDASVFPFTFDPLAELGGSLLQAQAISAECAEVIPVPPTNVAANRLTNSILGFGLVEAIPDADIQANATLPPPGVSGRVHMVPVLEDPGTTKVGRFGWKAQVATVMSFSADASLNEMGITNRILPQETAANGDEDLLAACDTVADPEDGPDAGGKHFIDRVTDFQRFVAPPPQTPRSGMTGETVFAAIGCANCHMQTFTTDDDEDLEKSIRDKELHPYSDFLLHDMGGNGDFIGQGDAEITELRTPPLWGMRIRDPLWHDGRVAGGTFDFRILMVVDQHNTFGSEGEVSALAFNALPTTAKNAVIAFLDSLGKAEFDMDGDGFITTTDQSLVQSCAAGPQGYTPDDFCAVADADQDGDVDVKDLDLLSVALGQVIPDDEDEDEDSDEGSDGGSGDPGDPGPGAGGDDSGEGGSHPPTAAAPEAPGKKSIGSTSATPSHPYSTTDEEQAEVKTPERRPRIDREKRETPVKTGRPSAR